MTRRRRKVYVDDLPDTHDFRYGVLFIAGFVLLLAVLYAVGHVVVGDKLPAGTTVAGIDVGGMRRDEARTVLQAQLLPRVAKPITAVAAGHRYRLDPQRAGLTLDLDATLAAGFQGSSWDPTHMFYVLTGGGPLQPVVAVNHMALRRTLRPAAAVVLRQPVSATVSFASGTPLIEYGRPGRVIDLRRSGARLSAALVSDRNRVRIAVRAVPPAITSGEASAFVEGPGTTAVSAPVSLRVANTTLRLSPHQFAPALRAVPDHGRLRLAMNTTQLLDRTRAVLTRLPNRPVNATIGFRGSSPHVVPSRVGSTVTPPDWRNAVLTAASLPAPHRVVRATATQQPPTLTTAAVRRLRISQLVAGVTVTSPPGMNGDELSHAVRQLNQTIIRPGQALSFLHTVNASRDQAVASVLASGLYDAAIPAGMTVVTRAANHTYSPAFPPGHDALVIQPGQDLVLRDDTPYGIFVRTFTTPSLGGTNLTVELWSTKFWRVRVHTTRRYNVISPTDQRIGGHKCVPRPGVPGFDVDVQRLFVRNGITVGADTLHSSYSPLSAISCGAS